MSTPPSHLQRGRAAEDLATRYLAQRGLCVVERNFRTRRGEIDIVAHDGPTLVFVEVRLRGSSAFGGAAASITARKRARLVAAAREYLARHRLHCDCRFDAVLLDGLDERSVEWLRNVFGD